MVANRKDLKAELVKPRKYWLIFRDVTMPSGTKRLLVTCHLLCFFSNEAHVWRVVGGRMEKSAVYTSVAAIEEE